MTHDRFLDGNIGRIYRELRSVFGDSYFQFEWLVKDDMRIGLSSWKFIFIKPYHMATAKYIFLDNIFLPMAFMRFKKDVKVVQLWHGCGAIKKFGQDTNAGILAKLEKRANNCYTHLIVNSKEVIKLHERAFGIEKNKIYPLGIPRTDFFFRKHEMESAKEAFYNRYPELRGKKILLYAPTFRDYEINKPKLILDVERLMNLLGPEYALLLHLHPFVSRNISIDHVHGVLYDVSNYFDLNALLLVADILITDYSSIIFEYSLLEKPVIFFAYDLLYFKEHSRGFYENYEDFVPGEIVYTIEELKNAILKNHDLTKIKAFNRKYFDYRDGKSSMRVISEVFFQENQLKPKKRFNNGDVEVENP